jgi:NAD-dependent dihydropyrimidine dehydrogenase PreA subunit
MIILSLHPSPDAMQNELQEAIVERCGALGVPCLTIPPLERIAEACEFWSTLAENLENPILACWLHPRPAVWLLQRHGIAIDESQIFNLNGFFDSTSASEMIFEKHGVAAKKSAEASAQSPKTFALKIEKLTAKTRERWYPIIDGSRCVNCGHCLQFCLFGVYELDEADQVRVRRPDQCKTGCPACSRICPHGAIMFPLYDKDDAIAGAPGRFVEPDAEARRMFYLRTKQACPVCGKKASRKQSSSSKKKICPECGEPLAEKSADEKTKPAPKPAFDDLDLLVDQLDRSRRRRPQHEE